MKNTILALIFLATTISPSFAENDALTTTADRVAVVEKQVSPVPPMPSDITATPEFQAVQAQVAQNPEILGDIQKLMEDPEVMSIISDPEFIAAVQSGNTAALVSNPRLQRLTENPKIQALIEKIKSQQ